MEICSAFLPRLTSKFVILLNLRPEKAVPRTTRDTVATAWYNFGKYHSALWLKYGKADFLFVFNDAKFMGPGIPAVDGLQWCGQVFTSQRAVAKKNILSNGKLIGLVSTRGRSKRAFNAIMLQSYLARDYWKHGERQYACLTKWI
jgi:hypothetical protein